MSTELRFTADTSQAVSEVGRIGDSVDRVSNKFEKLSNVAGNVPSPGNGGFSNADVLNAQLNQQQQTQVIQQIVNTSNANNASQVANVVNAAKGGGSGGNALASIANMAGSIGGGSGLAGMLAGLGPVGVALAAGAVVIGAGNKTVEQWEKEMPNVMGAYNSLTGGLGENSAKTNSANMREMFSKINNQRWADNVKFTNDDYMATMQQLSQFGYSNTDAALSDASNILRFENAGMGSRSQLISMQGIAARFGMTNALNAAYAGLEQSGMAKGQFDEFLSSMEDIMESSIAKGFVKGADEVATDMAMLEKLSGGSKLWQGQYGAENLQQMNSAMENATNLSSVNDIMLYRAVSGLGIAEKNKIMDGKYDASLGYIADMMLLERGVNAENIGAIFDMVNSEGGTAADKIARYKNMFGLNYTKANDVYQMSLRYKPGDAEAMAKTIQDYQANTENKSREQELLSAYETIKAKVVEIGADLLGAKTGIMKIVDVLVHPNETEESGGSGLFPVSGAEEQVFLSMLSDYKGTKSAEELNLQLLGMFEAGTSGAYISDLVDFQNIPVLKKAWEERNATAFFDILTDSDLLEYSDTFGLMTKEDSKTLKKMKIDKKLKKQFKGMSREDYDDLAIQYYGATGNDLWGSGSIVPKLQEIINLINNGTITIHSVPH